MANADPWTPPPDPDPYAILHETFADLREGRCHVALAKHVWFHNNALKYQDSLYGVRLSFALSYWKELAERYPPAMEALRQARDDAELRFHESGFAFKAFHDFRSLNRILGEEERTAVAFKVVDRTNPESAARLYGVAEDALIQQGEFALCGKYLEPETMLGSAIYGHEIQSRIDREELTTRPDFPQTATNRFVEKVATLIALLAKNGRDDDAQWVARTALAKVDCAKFQTEFDAALAGNLPASNR
jgi:hypothetical protein